MADIRLRNLALAALVLILVVLTGCAEKNEAAKPTPKVEPPAIGSAGKLRAGVDLSVPPFAGVDGSRKAGIDVDVAAALADRLGLTVSYVDVKPPEAATALADGTVDIVLSVPVAGADLTRLSTAGTYMTDGPVAFMSEEGSPSAEPSMTLASLPLEGVAAQNESEAYWLVVDEYGEETVKPYASLREAFQALDGGEAKVAVGDAFVGAYLGRDFPKIKMVGQLAPAGQLAVAAGAENTVLADAVRDALDDLAADGVLGAIRRKWVNGLPELKPAEAAVSSQEITAAP